MSYTDDWSSLRQHPSPQWLRDGKFGIYTHWGIYSVPACGPNVSWYPHNMYFPGNPQYDFHAKTYGTPDKFGYKDFIPSFTGEKFDPEEWADLVAASGAKFAGPVGEHHDGFPMWDTRYSEWKSTLLGPKRNVVAELEKAYRAKGLKFLVALHHAENWFFFPHGVKEYDTSDPKYAGLYGEAHDLGDVTADDHEWWKQTPMSKAFLDTWLNKTKEIIDLFHPDMLWFDFGIEFVRENYRRAMMAYYYNYAQKNGQEVALAYKYHQMAPGSGLVDLELGRFDELTYQEWITDSTVDDGQAWGYQRDAKYKEPGEVIRYLVDNVSKNGYLLLNVGPKPDGTFPDEAKNTLREIGRWLEVNGESIYGTTPWLYCGEGPTKLKKAGYFGEDDKPQYTQEDIRFTSKGSTIYATFLAKPQGKRTITTFIKLHPDEVAGVTLLADGRPLVWEHHRAGLDVTFPDNLPDDAAYVIKITRK